MYDSYSRNKYTRVRIPVMPDNAMAFMIWHLYVYTCARAAVFGVEKSDADSRPRLCIRRSLVGW